MNEQAKHVADGVAAVAAVSSLLGIIQSGTAILASLAAIAWYSAQLYGAYKRWKSSYTQKK